MSTPITLDSFSGDVFHPGGIDGNEVVGDFEFMSGGTIAGDDRFSGASDSYSGYTAYGDAYVMLDSSRGGDDYFLGGDNVYSGGIVPPIIIPSVTSDVTSLVSFFFSGGVEYAGDAAEMHDSSVGGNDTMLGGINSNNMFVGDALYAYDRVHGGSDSLVGGGAEDGYATNIIMGDAGQFGYSGGGDTRSAAKESSRESGKVMGGADYIEGGGASADLESTSNANFLVGDGYSIYGKSTGGADEIHGGSAVAHGDPVIDSFDASAINFIVGDAFQMQGTSTGGGDDLYGGHAQSDGGDAYAINFMAGDTLGMFGQAHAGNDVLTGGNADGPEVVSLDGYGTATLNLMAGDTFYSEGSVKFGDDTLIGGVGTGDGYVMNAMYGDSGDTALFLPPPLVGSTSFDDVSASGPSSGRGASYGDDTLVGGATQADNFLVGDAQEIFGKGGKGGDDLLIAGGWSTENTLIGDAVTMGDGAKGGKDILVSGEGNDMMWGDGQSFSLGSGGRGGGADLFVFGPQNGVDTINDFRARDRDKIDLSSFGDDPDFRNFKAFAASERMEQVDGGVLLHLDVASQQVQADILVESNTVLIVGVTLDQLTASSFIF